MTREISCQLLFWFSFATLVYTFVGYPTVIFFLSRFFSKSINQQASEMLPVTVVLAAHNEEKRIYQRLENLLSSEYPNDKLKIVVVSDGFN